ncbi:MAG: hypothetical protein HOL70_10435 [Candidatus Marinimicrobia bacterium]|nr:hypothetical protein [Candidatus Neomarinimicrobiota bacterium]
MKKTLTIILVGFLVFISGGCDNPTDNDDKITGGTNTLEDTSLNANFIGSSSDYFYDLEENVNVKFYRWDQENIGTPILFDPDVDTLNFRTFPEYLLSIIPGEPGEPYTDLNNNGVYDDGEPFEDQGNSMWDIGEPFTDANGNGFFDVGEIYEDLDDNGFWTGTERLMDVNGNCFRDSAETFIDNITSDGLWTPPETLLNEYLENCIWDAEEEYLDNNPADGFYTPEDEFDDENRDGVWSPAEDFEDTVNENGIWDDAEIFDDINENEVFDIGEPYEDIDGNCNYSFIEGWVDYFVIFGCGSPDTYDVECGDLFTPSNANHDVNGNGVWDDAEPFTDLNANGEWDGDTYTDANENCMWDDIEPIIDDEHPIGWRNPDEEITLDHNGNGLWDEAEEFTDRNDNEEWDGDETFDDEDGDGIWDAGEELTWEYIDNCVWDDAEAFIDVNDNNEWDNDGEDFADMDSDCIWDVGESFLDISDLSNPEWNGYTDRHTIHEEEVTVLDSVTINSVQYRQLNQMVWDFDLERYKAFVSDWEGQDTTIFFQDSFDSLVFQQSIIDLPDPDVSFYVDESEWIENVYIYSEGPSIFENTFAIHQKVVSSDSLFFRHPADCNLNGIVDIAEVRDVGETDCIEGDYTYDTAGQFGFCDLSNGVMDEAEPYLERDNPGDSGYGTRESNEPYVDLNCNGLWDDAEIVDSGNGIWDDVEPATLYTSSLEPNSLLVSYDNYPVLSNPRILSTVSSEEWFEDCGVDLLCPGDEEYEEADDDEGNGILDDGEEFQDYNNDGMPFGAADSLRTITGEWIYNIISADEFENYRTKEVANVDSMVTIFSNNIIEEIGFSQDNNDYYIAKTQWQHEESTNPGIILRNYDYHILRGGTNINKLVHPSYFLPPGFWGNTQNDLDYADGFWYENFTVDEILYYTPGGNFRDGERFVMDTTITTNVGDYYIQKSFSVDGAEVIVPARKILWYEDTVNNVMVCSADSITVASVISECPADTVFKPVFMVTNQLEMTMIGPGITYGERVVTWLSAGHGVVKEQLFYRWNQAPWASEHEWIEYSKIELAEYRHLGNSGGGLMRNLFGTSRSVRLDKLEFESDLDHDPYQVRRTAGFQRVSIPTNNN